MEGPIKGFLTGSAKRMLWLDVRYLITDCRFYSNPHYMTSFLMSLKPDQKDGHLVSIAMEPFIIR